VAAIIEGTKAAWCAAGPVLLVAWHKGITAPDVYKFTESTQAANRQHPTGFAVLSFTYTDVLVPDAEARAALLEVNKLDSPAYRGAVVVLTGSGFGASVARSIMGAMSLVRKQRAPEHMVKNLDEANEKLRELVTFSPDELRAVATQLLTHVGKKVP
jgi:hypothetical protein